MERKRALNLRGLALLGGGCVAAQSTATPAPTPTPQPTAMPSIAEIARATSPAMVRILTPRSGGSGIIVKSDGMILTANSKPRKKETTRPPSLTKPCEYLPITPVGTCGPGQLKISIRAFQEVGAGKEGRSLLTEYVTVMNHQILEHRRPRDLKVEWPGGRLTIRLLPDSIRIQSSFFPRNNLHVVIDRSRKDSETREVMSLLLAHRDSLGFQVFDFDEPEERDMFVQQSGREITEDAGDLWRAFWIERRGLSIGS